MYDTNINIKYVCHKALKLVIDHEWMIMRGTYLIMEFANYNHYRNIF